METNTAAKLLARRARKGYSPTESVALLARLTASHSGVNLAAALAYNDFATESQALKVVSA